jgi:hypothetical protein
MGRHQGGHDGRQFKPALHKSTYTTTGVEFANGFKYRAKFTNTIASEETNAATLTVTK